MDTDLRSIDIDATINKMADELAQEMKRKNITEPLMYRVRRILPFQFGGIDLTPMVIIIAIIFLRSFIVSTLHQLANQIS